MDPLSDVLSLMKPRAYASGGLTAGGRWAIHFTAYEGIKCYVVVKGECSVLVEGEPDPVRLLTGECLMLPHGRAFRLCSDLDVPPVDARTVFSDARYNATRAVTPGEDFFLLGGHFLPEGNADVLLSVLPTFVHLRKDSDKELLRGAVERIRTETREPQPGGFLIAQQSAYTMLVLALRLYLAEGERGGVGWLFALADKQMTDSVAASQNRSATSRRALSVPPSSERWVLRRARTPA